ncbi:MAG: hypothetical protein ACT4PV_11405 [Planctomycetaceae bacterium]
MGRLRPFLLPLLALVPLVWGCASKGEPKTGRVEADRPVGPSYAEPLMPAAWFVAEVEAAERERAEGDFRAAADRVERALRQRPRPDVAEALRELKRRVLQEALEMPTLVGRLEAVQDTILFDEPVRLRLVLENRSGHEVRAPASWWMTTGAVISLVLERRDVDTRAQVTTDRRSLHLRLTKDIDLPPGAVFEQEISLDASLNPASVDGIRSFAIRGVFRPPYLEVGGVRRVDPIRLRAATLRVFRPNYEHLADDPVARIGQAVEKRAPAHLLTAAALVPEGRRREAVDLLVAALRGDSPFDLTLFAALELLTAVEMGRDAAAWHTWWPRVRETYFDPPPERPDPAVPVFTDR